MDNKITRFQAQTTDKVIGYIYQTNDYDKFKFDKVNRQINKNRVHQLARQIQEMKVSALPIIIVNSDYVIIDGQHRFMAMKELGLPIFYYVDQSAGIKSIIEINSKQNRWKTDNFIHAFAQEGNETYSQLECYIDDYKRTFAPATIATILGEGTGKEGKATSKIVKSGKYKFGKLAQGVKFLKEIQKIINPRWSRGKRVPRSVALSFWGFYQNKDIDKTRLLRMINEDFIKDLPNDATQAKKQIALTYNRHKSKDRIEFVITSKGAFEYNVE